MQDARDERIRDHLRWAHHGLRLVEEALAMIEREGVELDESQIKVATSELRHAIETDPLWR